MSATDSSRHQSQSVPLSPGTGFAALSFGVNLFIVLLSAVVTSRLYGVEVIGQYALVMVPWQLLISLSTIGEQIALVRRLAGLPRRSTQAAGVTYAVMTFSVAFTSLVGLLVLVVSSVVLGGPLDHPELIAPCVVLVAGSVILENPGWNIDSVFSAHNEGRRLFMSRLTTVMVFLVLAVAFYSLTDSVWGLVAANLVSFGVGLVVRVLLARGLIARFPGRATFTNGLRELPELLRFGIRLLPSQFFVGVTQQAPTWIIAGRAPIGAVGAYSRAAGMAIRLNEAGYRINEMLFPHLVRLNDAGEHEAFARTLQRSLRTAAAALLLAAAIAGGLAPEVMKVFGTGFEAGAAALALLTVVHVIFVLSNQTAAAFNALGRPQVNSFLASVRCVVGLGLVAAWIGPHGITGAAAGLCLGYGLELAVRLIALRRATVAKLPPLGLQTVVGAVASYAAGFTAARLVTWIDANPLFLLAGGSALAVFAYGVAATATGLVDAYDRASLRRVLAPLIDGAHR